MILNKVKAAHPDVKDAHPDEGDDGSPSSSGNEEEPQNNNANEEEPQDNGNDEHWDLELAAHYAKFIPLSLIHISEPTRPC